jgi:hypothetical protein
MIDICATKFYSNDSFIFKNFYTNRNYFNDPKTHIEPNELNVNVWFFSMYKAIFKHVFDIFLKFFYNVLDMRKAMSISAPCPEVPHLPLRLKMSFCWTKSVRLNPLKMSDSLKKKYFFNEISPSYYDDFLKGKCPSFAEFLKKKYFVKGKSSRNVWIPEK